VWASRRAAAVTVAALLALAGCGSDDEQRGSGSGGTENLPVVATTTQMADFVRQVGGDRVAVTQLLQPNSDPHEYEPRPSDIRKVGAAELVVSSGGDLDGWIGDVVKQAGGDAELLDAGANRPITLEGGTHEDEHAAEEEHAGEEGHAAEDEHAGEGEHAGEEHGAGEADPHWWHHPDNAKAAVAAIASSLSKADPAGAASYAERARAYTERITEVDTKIERCTGQVPAGERKLVTDHDAFAYLADAYDLEVVGAVIPATTTQAQPSAGEVAKLSDTIERENVRVIFPESSLNPRLARSIAERTGARVGGTLYADTLGPEGTPGATYLGSMAANADTLVRGFTGGEQRCEMAGVS